MPDRVPPAGEEETSFTTEDGYQVPALRDYRYEIKSGWRFVASLQALSLLEGIGLLEEAGRSFLRTARGRRTLTMPVVEIAAGALQYIEPHADRFVGGREGATTVPILSPSDADLRAVVNRTTQAQAAMLSGLPEAGAMGSGRILEIGFFTGYSAFGYERLGFEVTAIDNDYGEESQAVKPAPQFAGQLGSRVSFQTDDICRVTSFPDEHFPLIVSTSVLEHIMDLPAAFAEMWRILRPGGAMIHGYHPYFCADGAHALGISDCPWGHLRMSDDDYLRYMDKLRPHEAVEAKKWLRQSLHRAYPIHEIQRLVISQGLMLARWDEIPSPAHHLSGLDRGIVARCLGLRPGLTLRDLVSRTVRFVAVKPC